MLARALPGVPVLVGADRYLSGRLAEESLGARVHLLDDGFQHVQLWRDVDLLAASEDDLHDTPLPGGRLREALPAAADADAALVDAGYGAEAERIGRALRLLTVFRVVRTLGPPRVIETGDTVVVPADEPVFAVAGIARPERFFTDLASAGWRVAGTMRFRDHHMFSNRDVARVATAARAAGATLIMTTEKDAVRLAGRNLGTLPAAAVPLIATIEPTAAFADWLLDRLRTARRTRTSAHGTRTQHPAPGTEHRSNETPPRIPDREGVHCGAARHARCGGARVGQPARPGVSYLRPRASPDRGTQPGDGVSVPDGGGAARHRPRGVQTLRPAAVRAAEVQHAVAAGDAGAGRVRRGGACPRRLRARERACCSSPGTSGSGRCTPSPMRCKSSRSACSPARSTTSG